MVLKNRIRDASPARGDVQQRLDIEVVSSQDNLEQHLLINGDKLLVPFTDVGRSLSVFVRVGFISCRQGLAAMMLAVFQNLCDIRDQWTRYLNMGGAKTTNLF